MNRSTVWGLAAAAAALLWAGAPSSARAEDAPCDKDARFSQQDFILGDWIAYTDGRKTARVHMEKILKGCAIRETWTPLDPSETNGTGLFTYSRLLGHWGYFWVAEGGWATDFSGDAQGEGGAMLYVTFAPPPDGGRRERHWTLKKQADGSIEELSLGSTDGGRSWAQEYRIIWRRPR